MGVLHRSRGLRGLPADLTPERPPRRRRAGIYRDVTLTCNPDGPVTIHVGPVLDGDNDMVVSGSHVAAYPQLDGETALIVSAVM